MTSVQIHPQVQPNAQRPAPHGDTGAFSSETDAPTHPSTETTETNTVTAPTPVAFRHVQIQTLSWLSPFKWLGRGLQDFRASAVIGLFYGLCFWGMAWSLSWIFQSKPEYTMSLVSGCLLVGPWLAMGLYDASKRLSEARTPSLLQSLVCWRKHLASMSTLVLVLTLLELLWGRASLVVFALFFNTGMPSSAGVIQAIFNPENWEFVIAYLVVGGVFAALVFATSVVSIPMILDTGSDAITAGITSIRVVLSNMLVMILWGVCITLLTVLALWPGVWLGGWGLVLVGPWLGYASWHAYRDSVRITRLPEDPSPSQDEPTLTT